MHTRSTIIAFSLGFFVSVHGAEYEGAAKLLERVESSVRSGKGESANPVLALKGRIAEFRKGALAMAPDAAARGWLELYDAYAAIPTEEMTSNYSLQMTMKDLVTALPPSSSWEELAGQVSARPDEVARVPLELLMRFLRGTPDDVPGTLAMVQKAYVVREQDAAGSREVEPFEGGPPGRYRGWGNESETSPRGILSDALNLRAGRHPDPKTVFLKALENLEKNPSSDRYRYLALPEMQGPDVDSLIMRSIQTGASINWGSAEMRKRAAELILKDPALLKAPIWDLAEGRLYDVMLERFPKRSEEESDFDSATLKRLASLLEEGENEAARKLFSEKFSRSGGNGGSWELFPSSEEEKAGMKSVLFLEELLTAAPILPCWDSYALLSSRLGRDAEALAFMKKAAASPETVTAARSLLQLDLVSAMMAAGEVDAAVEIIRARVTTAGKQQPPLISDEDVAKGVKQLRAVGIDAKEHEVRKLIGFFSNREQERAEALPLKLARLGQLLKKQEWVNEGISAALALDANEEAGYGTFDELSELLVLNGRGAEAERRFSQKLIASVSKKEGGRAENGRSLQGLVELYRRAGRWEDIVSLLDKCPYWGASDLADVEGGSDNSVQLAAAQAFAATGKKDLAVELVDRCLQTNPKKDAVYQLLLDLGGPGVEAKLDLLAKANRFEERPLIWKAVVQLREGRTEEAEKTIRAAIAIDPSDGEEGKGDRMRAYAVLADVLEKKGDMEQAKIMRGAVSAVRLSEDADDWRYAGLTKKAAEMYEQALTLFADAYCIQSRLALTYSHAGEHEKAEAHYRRAFELMPDSFGRIESHCFGCEGTFSRESSQGVAEKVFTRLAAERPDSAQVFYLLGYLRDSQNRDEEAAVAYRRAVEIDPDYVNAWLKLQALEIKRPESETNVIAVSVMRLGMSNAVSSSVLTYATDLPGLWDAILTMDADKPIRSTGPIYRLMASTGDANGSGRNQQEDFRSAFTSTRIVEIAAAFMDILIPRK